MATVTSVGGGSATFYEGKGGKLKTRDGQEFPGVTGFLSAIKVKDDPGNSAHKIAPGKRVIVTLTDGDQKEVVIGRLDQTFGWMLGSAIAKAPAGAEVLISATNQGANDASVTFAAVKVMGDAGFEPITRDKYEKATREATIIAQLEAHPAFLAPQDDDGDEGEVYDPLADTD